MTLAPLNTVMECGILSNEAGALVFLHNLPLPEGIDYLKYDEVSNRLSLIYSDGREQNTGLDITEDIAYNFFAGQEVQTVLIKDKKIVSRGTVLFVFSEA